MKSQQSTSVRTTVGRSSLVGAFTLRWAFESGSADFLQVSGSIAMLSLLGISTEGRLNASTDDSQAVGHRTLTLRSLGLAIAWASNGDAMLLADVQSSSKVVVECIILLAERAACLEFFCAELRGAGSEKLRKRGTRLHVSDDSFWNRNARSRTCSAANVFSRNVQVDDAGR